MKTQYTANRDDLSQREKEIEEQNMEKYHKMMEIENMKNQLFD